jgi:hypothetical protein
VTASIRPGNLTWEMPSGNGLGQRGGARALPKLAPRHRSILHHFRVGAAPRGGPTLEGESGYPARQTLATGHRGRPRPALMSAWPDGRASRPSQRPRRADRGHIEKKALPPAAQIGVKVVMRLSARVRRGTALFGKNRRYEGLDARDEPLAAIAAMVSRDSFRPKPKADQRHTPSPRPIP